MLSLLEAAQCRHALLRGGRRRGRGQGRALERGALRGILESRTSTANASLVLLAILRILITLPVTVTESLTEGRNGHCVKSLARKSRASMVVRAETFPEAGARLSNKGLCAQSISLFLRLG